MVIDTHFKSHSYCLPYQLAQYRAQSLHQEKKG